MDEHAPDIGISSPILSLPQVQERAAPALPPVPLLRQPLPHMLAYSACPTLGEFLAAHSDDVALLPLLRRLTEARLPAADQGFFADYPETIYLVAVVNIHLPDTPAVLPLWVRLAQACPRAELRVLGDDDPVALKRLLGGEIADLHALELPMLLILDEEYTLQAQWGPRPQAAEPVIDEWLTHHPRYETLLEAEANGALAPEDMQELADLHHRLMLQMRVWFNSGLDAEGSGELRTLLTSLHDESDTAL